MGLKHKKLVRTIQVILGLALLFFGANALLQFFEVPPFNEAGTALLTALFNAGYFFPLIGIVWIVAGLMFVFNKWSAFAAVLIFPLSLNIVLFHVFLDFSGWIGSFVILILNLYLMHVHWDVYQPMFAK